MHVSILGDSISTYQGFNPVGYAVYYDPVYAKLNGMTTVYDTWWAKVNQFLRAMLCVNNSWAGSMVSGAGFSAAGSPERTSRLHTEQAQPDIILVYMGFNDFAGGVSAEAFEEAYEKMLTDLQRNYPRAWIFCGTLMRSCLQDDPGWIFPERVSRASLEEMNGAIRRACRNQGCVLADLAARNVRYETLDGTHPTREGHSTLAQCWVSCLKKE